MKKFTIMLFMLCILVYFPVSSYAVSNTDMYTQQNISGTYITSGYADILLQKNAKNVLMEILYHQITDYIFENTDPVTANKLSVYMPNNLQECDDEYLSNITKEVDLNYADTVLNICREDVYTLNLEYLIKETAGISKGSYYILLENMFKNHTQEILNMKEFTMDKFINILAVNNLMSFNGRLFFDEQNNIPLENIKCENNHTPIDIINYKTNTPVDNITINNKNLFLKACLVQNRQNFFKYIMVYENINNNYSLYARIPVYNRFYKKDSQIKSHNAVFIDVNKYHLFVKEPLAAGSFLTFDYLFLNKDISLVSLLISKDNNSEVIYYDKNNSHRITPQNISLKLYKTMMYDHCMSESSICSTNQIEYLLNISNTQNYK